MLSSLAFGVQDTISYDLLSVDKLGSAAVNTVVHVILLILGLGAIYVTKQTKILKDVKTILSNYSLWIILAGVCALLGNVLLYWAYQLGSSVNPGVITTIGNGAVVVSTLLAYFFYNATVTVKQSLGMAIMLVAFGMAAMGNKLFAGELSQPKKEHQHSKDQHSKDQHSKDQHSKDQHSKGSGHMWVFVVVISAIAYGGLSFFQYVITKKDSKLNMIALAICVALVEAVIGLVVYCLAHIKEFQGIERGPFKNYRKDINSLTALKYLPYTVSTAACDGIGLATLLKSYTLAENPGFSDVVSDTYSIVQGALTYLVYGKKMDMVQGLSVVIAIIGAGMINIK